MAKTFATVINDVDKVQYEIDQPLITVKITNLKTGFTATGHAKCDPTDEWSEKFGFDLAYVRALNRVTRKLERYYTNTLSKYYSRSLFKRS